MPSTRVYRDGARNSDRSSENALKMKTVEQKIGHNKESKSQSANHSLEMRPKMATVGQKRSHGVNGPEPEPRPCKTPSLPSL